VSQHSFPTASAETSRNKKIVIDFEGGLLLLQRAAQLLQLFEQLDACILIAL
jgi:hypothetical protein